MKDIKDLKLEEEVTIYRYDFSEDNKILITPLTYVVWSIQETYTPNKTVIDVHFKPYKHYCFYPNGIDSCELNEIKNANDNPCGNKCMYSLSDDEKTRKLFKDNVMYFIERDIEYCNKQINEFKRKLKRHTEMLEMIRKGE